MPIPAKKKSTNARLELVFGLVGPTGVDLTKVCASLESELKGVGYKTEVVWLSELILPYVRKQRTFRNDFDRVKTLMDEGTKLRRSTGQADIIARLGLAQIRALRKQLTGSAEKVPDAGIAYIVRSFKRPEEVNAFRDVYGKTFNLISVYAPRAARVQNLTKRMKVGSDGGRASPEELAVRLINRDYDEEGRLGQQVGKTFPMADYFVTSESRVELERQMRRLVRLVFGDPYISPTKDEQGMFFAHASALRSLDLSRQVGAAVVTDDGDILATGCNEVPKYGGGLYWADDTGCARDFEKGHDSNFTIKAELVEDAVRRLREHGLLAKKHTELTDQEIAGNSLFGDEPFLRDSKLFDVIEFGRAVHAEMAAITQAAKVGVGLRGARLLCTTFPCHVCARHIVAAGIREVVFIEPYEKSRTSELHADSISVEPNDPPENRATFRAFVGVAPRRYIDFFQMSTDRKTAAGKTLDAKAIAATPRIKRIILSYLYAEAILINETQLPARKSPAKAKKRSARTSKRAKQATATGVTR